MIEGNHLHSQAGLVLSEIRQSCRPWKIRPDVVRQMDLELTQSTAWLRHRTPTLSDRQVRPTESLLTTILK